MKSLFFLLTIAVPFLSGCSKEEEQRLPKCIQAKVSAFPDIACEQGAKVEEDIFQNKTVFVFEIGLCGADQTSEVVDENCNTLGWLGGWTGNTKINGEDFSDATFVKTIWSR